MVTETTENATVNAVADATIARLIAAGIINPTGKQKKARINWERILAYEYVEKFYAEVPHWYRIEVGPVPGGRTESIYAKTRRWADCVVRMPDHMLVIEFKMKAEPSVVSQVLVYKDLVPQTALFKKYSLLPVKAKIVAAMVDDVTHAFIEKQGIDLEIYKPSNFEQWYQRVILKNTEA